ncbi:hybrid sensor histidine kinase/response regulator [Paraliomyxa miuraensis]|uniref:hybrid sensor histidine kinase/response regulator n=1 Tax=Paraliomyxa miuraensis TaxID=376150 RepID=UPI002256EF58|nr:response regulator [Paraliomyxa miuraensis]MCX4242591.1 response regulator [Paraliomyxa miuraensis]
MTTSRSNQTDPPMSGGRTSYRILVVDDNPSIHDDFRRIFAVDRARDEDLDMLAAAVFGLPVEAPRPSFALDHVDQGQAALERVLVSNDQGQPYALLFMDVRMPPGWDGLEAARRVLEADPDVHVVLCTAYPERRWRQRVEALPGRDRVLVLKKPFDVLEVQQLAYALCEKWRYARRDRARMSELETSVNEQRGQLAVVESRLRKAERLESLGRMAAGLCHEINNPLSYIVTSAELTQDLLGDLDPSLSPKTRSELDQLIAAISVGANRITRLVRNIRLFARRNDAAMEVVDLSLTVDTALAMIQPQRYPNVVIEVRAAGAAPAAGRRFELEQVLINLVENAMHAMEGQHDPAPRITITARTEGDLVAIDVADTGPGIDEAVIDSIFDPFFTTKPVNKGTGLGLSICHSLIEGMSGTIDVRNRERPNHLGGHLGSGGRGGGAVFTVRLPLATSIRPAAFVSAEASGAVAVPRRGRILVVDDEPFMRSSLERVLQPHAVTSCSSVEDALARCSGEGFDVILCDIMMPGLNGYDFHRRLAQERPGMEERVVFITGGALRDEVREVMARVPNRTLEKPLDGRELRAFVSAELERLAVARAAAS